MSFQSKDGEIPRKHLRSFLSPPGTENITQAKAAERSAHAAQALKESYQGMAKKDRGTMALRDLGEAMSQGVARGPAQDALLESRDWGFPLGPPAFGGSPAFGGGAGTGPGAPVLMWHGENDQEVPVRFGRYLAAELAGGGGEAGPKRRVDAHFIEGESHSLIRRHWETILNDVVAAAKAHAAQLRKHENESGDCGNGNDDNGPGSPGL